MGPGSDVIVRRGEPIAGPPGPILIATRNDALDGIVDATPPERRPDLVFLQNGMLQPWLDSRGLGDATQVLVYFAVAKLGDAPTDGKTDVNPEGLTAACGVHAEAVAARLRGGGLSCKVLDRPAFTRAMLEKLVWISAFMLVGAKHKATVGEVEARHGDEVSALIQELADAGAADLGVTLEPGVVPRLTAYARSVSHFPTAVKEFKWRNGYFHALSQAAAAAGKPDPCPLHSALLRETGSLPASSSRRQPRFMGLAARLASRLASGMAIRALGSSGAGAPSPALWQRGAPSPALASRMHASLAGLRLQARAAAPWRPSAAAGPLAQRRLATRAVAEEEDEAAATEPIFQADFDPEYVNFVALTGSLASPSRGPGGSYAFMLRVPRDAGAEGPAFDSFRVEFSNPEWVERAAELLREDAQVQVQGRLTVVFDELGGASVRVAANDIGMVATPSPESLVVGGEGPLPAATPGQLEQQRAASAAAAPPGPAPVAAPGMPEVPGSDKEALWMSLYADPGGWYDNRDTKTGRQPDFKRKADGAALWVDSNVTPAEGEAQWVSVFTSYREWWDNRANKRNPKAPDFKHKSNGAALWLSSRETPAWVLDNIDRGLPPPPPPRG
ncbi:OSB4 [Scenedesmus sp. PABB004]|nr:OSB4 [Scenedesmus sp. PABB004]